MREEGRGRSVPVVDVFAGETHEVSSLTRREGVVSGTRMSSERNSPASSSSYISLSTRLVIVCFAWIASTETKTA
jgi:hypothetical protein